MLKVFSRGVPIIGSANQYSRYWPFLLNIGIGIIGYTTDITINIITAGDGWLEFNY